MATIRCCLRAPRDREMCLPPSSSCHRFPFYTLSRKWRLTLSAAFQALVVLAEVQKGDDVLVHAGASGVGIAAIQLARLYGA